MESSDYLDEVLHSSKIEFSVEEMNNIGRAVEGAVAKLVHEVGCRDSRFRASELLKVGSFNEGTKIHSPDEFDFVVVIEELSADGILDVIPSSMPGYVHLQMRDKSNEKWGEILRTEDEYRKTCGLSETYGKALLSVVQYLANEKGAYGEVNITSVFQTCILFDIENERLEFNKLHFKSSPNIILGMKWQDLRISVDLSPAIRYFDLTKVLREENCVHPKLYQAVQQHGSCILVGKKIYDYCTREHIHLFRASFTETEVAFVQNLILTHRKVYMYLKTLHECYKSFPLDFGNHSLMNVPLPSKLTSYMLKTASIYHELMYERTEHSPVECVDFILTYLRDCVDNGFMPDIFDKEQDLLMFESARGKYQYQSTIKQLNIMWKANKKIIDLRSGFDLRRLFLTLLEEEASTKDRMQATEVIYQREGAGN